MPKIAESLSKISDEQAAFATREDLAELLQDADSALYIAKKGALWATPEAIAAGILNAIDKQRDVVYLPRFWRLIMLIISHIPEGIFKRLKI